MHDTVVNQLLTKIDGVEQLNNILVIGKCKSSEFLLLHKESNSDIPCYLHTHAQIICICKTLNKNTDIIKQARIDT